VSHVTSSSSALSEVLLLPFGVFIAFTRQAKILRWIFLLLQIGTAGGEQVKCPVVTPKAQQESSSLADRQPFQGQTLFPVHGSSPAEASLDRRCISERTFAPG
jgi:hypothetical protein